ncbi:MAG: Response regulator uvrY [Bacteroidota bacterium]
MLRIAIAEDEERHLTPIIQEVSAFKKAQINIISKNGFDLLMSLKTVKHLPEILLLDIKMPKIDGLLLTQHLTFIHPSIKIIGVSSHSNEALVTEVLSEGACGFITKFLLNKASAIYQGTYGNRNILIEAMEAVLDNKEYIDSLLFNQSGSIKKSKSTKAIIRENFENLPDTQIEYLILNAANLSHTEIAKIMNKSLASVKNYFNLLSAELNVSTRSELVYYCTTNGIVKHPKFYDKSAN